MLVPFTHNQFRFIFLNHHIRKTTPALRPKGFTNAFLSFISHDTGSGYLTNTSSSKSLGFISSPTINVRLKQSS